MQIHDYFKNWQLQKTKKVLYFAKNFVRFPFTPVSSLVWFNKDCEVHFIYCTLHRNGHTKRTTNNPLLNSSPSLYVLLKLVRRLSEFISCTNFNSESAIRLSVYFSRATLVFKWKYSNSVVQSLRFTDNILKSSREVKQTWHKASLDERN